MTARLVVLLLVVVAVPMRSAADVAGTGTFDIFATANGGLDFDGAIAFDGGIHTVLGRQVNLARFVGTMTYDGEVLGEPSAGTAIFTLEADADETDVSFVAGGSVSCTAATCVGGSATFAGRLEVTSDEDDALPDGAFTFDGTVEIDELGEGFGTFAINAFPVVSTPAGAGVEIESGEQLFVDSVTGSTRSFAARATFDEVAIEGATSFAALSTGSGALPPGVVLDPAVSVFVDVQTTAVGDGLRICLAFPDETGDGVVDGTDIAATQVRLLRATFVGSEFVDMPAVPGAGEVCASVPDLGGLFVLGVADGTGATTTTIATGETTTTSMIGQSTTSSTLPGEGTTTTSTVVGEPSTTTSSTVSGVASTTTTSTVVGAPSTTTSSTVSAESTTTTISGPESTSTTCATSTTSSTVASTLPVPGPTTSTSTTISRAPTTTSTLPVCATALDCLELTIAEPLCLGETLNPKLATLVRKKLTKAQAVLARSRTAASAQKAGKLVAKARKQLDRIAKKADAFVSRRRQPISLGCRDQIKAALQRVAQQIEANRI